MVLSGLGIVISVREMGYTPANLSGRIRFRPQVLVEQALNHLVKQGLLKRHVLVEGTILYELAPPTPPS
jgi:hypothetical protein